MNTLRPLERLMQRQLPWLLAGSLAVGACGSGPHSNAEANAACQRLDVKVLDEYSRLVRITPEYRLSGGAKYMGVTYIFDPNVPSTTVDVGEDPTGTIVHEFPPAVDTSFHIEADINYAKPGGHGSVWGGMPICETDVVIGTFKPAALDASIKP